MPIAPIGAIAPIASTTPVAGASGASGTSAAGGASGSDFGSMLSHGLDAVNGAQTNADSLAVQAATGSLVDPAQYTIAATQASLMTQLAVTVQSKAVAAFNEIMGMQA